MEKETVLGSMLTQTEPVFFVMFFVFYKPEPAPKEMPHAYPKQFSRSLTPTASRPCMLATYSSAMHVGNLESTILMALYDGNRRPS